MSVKQIISLTEAAAARMRCLLERHGKESVGIRIGVRATGCSGMSYTVSFADERGPHDEVVEYDGITVYVDPQATLFLMGTEMDYIEEALGSRFVFNNPNEKGRCGCGESFRV